jgi:hypothetical protein
MHTHAPSTPVDGLREQPSDRPVFLAGLAGEIEERGLYMSARAEERRSSVAGRHGGSSSLLMRLSTETKHSFKTTEFWVMVAIIVGILIASKVVGQGDGNANSNTDAFPAVRAWLYIAIVAVGYMVSRGLAKAGSRDPYWADSDDLPSGDNR